MPGSAERGDQTWDGAADVAQSEKWKDIAVAQPSPDMDFSSEPLKPFVRYRDSWAYPTHLYYFLDPVTIFARSQGFDDNLNINCQCPRDVGH